MSLLGIERIRLGRLQGSLDLSDTVNSAALFANGKYHSRPLVDPDQKNMISVYHNALDTQWTGMPLANTCGLLIAPMA
jgi:hypothetical protein